LLFLLLSAAGILPAGEDRQAVLERDLPRLKGDLLTRELRRLGPETDLSREYYRLLTRYVRYAAPKIRPWPDEAGASYHKRDGSKEHDVRQNASVALGFAVLSAFGAYDEKEAGVPRDRVKADAAALVRYLAVTHAANFRPTGDGKAWGDHWQSAYWAASPSRAQRTRSRSSRRKE
jgi:hypothetical protein